MLNSCNTIINMRNTIFAGIYFSLMLFTSCEQTEIVTSSNKKNVILIVTDDVRYDALQYAQTDSIRINRFPYVLTPNLDFLASKSTNFTNAFTVMSICSPSRASILTGIYPHQHGIVDNYHSFTISYLSQNQ